MFQEIGISTVVCGPGSIEQAHKVDEFITSKISKNSFSILHLNIASLQGHINDLKDLLSLLFHRFSVIGITETRIKEGNEPLINIDINGYTFKGVGTKSLCGGVGLYIRNDLDFSQCKNLCISCLN